MAAATPSGNPYNSRSGGFRFTWRGAELADAFDQALQDAMTATGEAAKAAAEERCPVDSGLLKSSIFAIADVGGGAHRRKLIVGADAPYAMFVELGTSTHQAQPFIRPAIDQEAPKLTERARAALAGLR